MKISLNKNVRFFCLFIILGLSSCNEDLIEINKNKDYPTSVPVDEFLAPLELGLSREYSEHTFRVVNKMMNYTEQPTRHWDEYMESEEDDYWMQHFNQLRNIDYIIQKASSTENYHVAAALIIKSWSTYVASSLHGDIPYSQAGKAKEGVNLPAYDTQQKIFEGILSDLEKANRLLSGGGIAMSKDALLGGDPLKWRKFANSLKVRVLIAQSKKVNPSNELKRMLSNPDTYPMMESNEDQPAYTYNSGAAYPNGPGFHMDFTFMGVDFVNTLLTLRDQRILAYASPTANSTPNNFAGIPIGTTPNAGGDPNNYSLLSQLFFKSATVHSLQTVWMSYAELNLLLAEAAEKGWISGGTNLAKTYYDKAIEASYKYQRSRVEFAKAAGVSIISMAEWNPGYLSLNGVNYTGDKDAKLKLIAQQKWIALFNDIESYFSWKRTKLPVLTSNPKGPGNGVLPLRYKYPNNERNFNTENVNAAITIQGPDERNTLMWLLK